MATQVTQFSQLPTSQKERKVRAAFYRLFDQTNGHPDLLDKMVLSITRKAIAGDVNAFNAVADRVDGKVPQAVVGDDEHPPAFHAWLQWMQILAGDTRSLSPNANAINGLVTIGAQATDALPALRDARAALEGPAGADLVPSAQEETSAP